MSAGARMVLAPVVGSVVVFGVALGLAIVVRGVWRLVTDGRCGEPP